LTNRRQPGRHRLVAIATLVVTSLAVTTACGTNDAKTEEELEAELAAALGLGEDIEVDLDPETDIVTVDSEQGSFVRGAGQERPTWLPAAIPVPDDLVIDWSSELGGIFQLTGTTGADAETLRATYAAAAEASGWTVEPQAEPIEDEEIILLAVLADGRPLDVRLDNGALELFIGRFWPTPE
jgi:hypothetical protein